MQGVDQTILTAFVENRTTWLSFLMLIVTYAGGYLVASIVTTLSALSFIIHKKTHKLFALLVSVLGSTLTVFLLKNIFDKARPIKEAFYLETTPSFPSGHATIAVALYGFLLYAALKQDKHHLKIPIVIFFLTLILAIGISRLYLGVHYFSDVLVGYLLGAICLTISVGVSKLKI